jgi:general L-amino acid transport system substrate-binding protein
MKSLLIAASAAALLASGAANAQSTQEAVAKKGFVQCGVNVGLAGFSQPDSQGVWKGIDVDLCRAVAAAVLGDASKVRYTPLTAQQRFTALQSGEVDILSRNTTWTIVRDTSLGLNFVGVNYYDGQGFMVRKGGASAGAKDGKKAAKAARAITSARQLNGATVCVQPGTTTELNLADYFRTHKMTFKPVVIEKLEEVLNAYFAGRCDVYTTDVSGLVAVRASRAPKPDEHVILPEIISKEPLGPAVRQDDDQWFNIARWTLFALVNAEELGVTAANVDEMKAKSTNPDVKRLLGAEGEMGKNLGLTNEWGYNIVKRVGNYGEVFARNLGDQSPLKITRGINELWNKGGVMYAPPIR